MVVNNSTNLFGIDLYVVDPVPGKGGYTTIGDAINAVQAAGVGTIWINPGTYNESISISSQMDLIGNVAADSQSITINGNVTISNFDNSVNFQNIIFSSSTGDTITIPSSISSSTQIAFTYCNIESLAGNGINATCPAGTNYTIYLNSVGIQSNNTAILHNGPNGSVIADTCTIISTNGSALDITGIEFQSYFSQIQGAADYGIILEDASATAVIIGGILQSTDEFFNFMSTGEAICSSAVMNCSAGSGYIATGAASLIYGDLTILGSASGFDPAMTLYPLETIPGIKISGDTGSISGSNLTIEGDSTITTNAASGNTLQISSPYVFSARSPTLDMTVMGNSVNVYTVPAGKTFLPTLVIGIVNAASDTTQSASFNFGTSPGYDDLWEFENIGNAIISLPSVYYYGTDAFTGGILAGAISPYPAGTVLGAIITTPASATTYTGYFYIQGVFI